MPPSLRDRYQGAVLITGASSGLGDSFARRFAKEGFDVVLVARRKDRLESLAKNLAQQYNVKALPIAQDLTADIAAERIKSALDDHRIEIGVLINNAGYGSHGYFHDLDATTETSMVDLNCRTPVALTQAFLPGMIARKNGALIFLASVAAYQPTPFFATYGATKAFNLMFAESLWAELKPFGIDVISLSPGYTKTEFQQVANVTLEPPGPWAKPDDVIDHCLQKLGRAPSTVPGFLNRFMAGAHRFMPRSAMARFSHKFSKPKELKTR